MLEKQNLLNRTALFGLRRRHKEESIFERRKRLYFRISIFLGLIIVALAYYFSSISNIYRITVDGNFYLKDEDILKISELSEDDKYLFFLPALVENRVENDPLIRECKVVRLDDRLVQINVVENKIVAYLEKANGYELIMDDDTRIPLGEERRYLIGTVPLIEGFTDEQIRQILVNLKECDHKVINEISEIHNYPDLKYQNVELIMRDGNYIFTSPFGLNILNHYHNIQSSYVSNRKVCYYFEDISGNAYSSACPWEIVEEEQTEDIEQDEDYYDGNE